MKNFYIGLIIGITSLIPGISAGTIIYISDEFSYITNLITHFQKNIKELITLFIGILFGVLSFAKVLEFLFSHYYIFTMSLFISFITFNFIKTISKNKNFNLFYIFIGIVIIYLLFISTPSHDIIITTFPKLTLVFLIIFGLCGFLDGFLTITPGISGSMVMMILGPYYLYKSYLANFTLNFTFILPMLVYFLGDALGLLIGSKTSIYLIKKIPIIFNNLIIGLIAGSIIILIPNFFLFKDYLTTIFLILMLFITRKKAT